MDQPIIHSDGIVLTDLMRKNILQKIESVFGYEKDEVSKISIVLADETPNELEWYIHIKLRNYPVIKTQFRSLDVLNAITLSLERAYLKSSRRAVPI